MKFSVLMRDLPMQVLRDGDADVTAIVTDSRAVVPGALFFAREGWFVDSHRFLASAQEQGATSFVVTRPDALEGTDYAPVAHSTAEDRDLGLVCDRFFGEPTMELKVYGITGTNGKTSTAYLLEHILRELGERPAVIGTVSHRFEDHVIPAKNTTPDGLTIHGFAREAKSLGATCLVLEVSSHGAELGRIAGVAFDVVGFTNLSVDHLDYHKTLEAYQGAKELLFSEFLEASSVRGKRTHAVAWTESAGVDTVGATMLAASAPTGTRTRVGVDAEADLQVEALRWLGTRGVELRATAHGRLNPGAVSDGAVSDGAVSEGAASKGAGVEQVVATSTLVGSYNLENVAVALAMVHATHPDRLADAADALQRFAGIPGRFEAAFAVDGIPTAFVDYAHTPDAVARAARVLADLDDTQGTVVLGCGGDRDRTKRPQMTRAALEALPHVVLTADNPRSERVEDILDEMVADVDGAARAVRIANRSEAIERAIRDAQGPVLIAGKGHETYQEVDGVRYHFDDREEARRSCRARMLNCPASAVPLLSGWSVERIAAAMGGRVVRRGANRPFGVLSTDSRTIGRDDIFVALKGARFDAHTFVEMTDAAGAGLVIVDADAELPSVSCGVVAVPSTHVALQRLATALLTEARTRRDGLRVLAITGSNGKTTTKELAAALLGEQALATPGNFNNHIGLPLTVAAIAPKHRYAVLEMGANAPTDIAELAAIATPDVGIITSIGLAHVEGFGDLDGVRNAKMGIGASGLETVVVPAAQVTASDWPASNPLQHGMLTFGDQGAATTATMTVTRADAFGPACLDGADISLGLPGLHNAMNLAAAVLGVQALTGAVLEPADIAARVSDLALPAGRLRRETIAGRVLIDDAYNANPASMEASLRLLAGMPSPRIAVLGEMRELGDAAAELHAQVGAIAAECADIVMSVGASASAIAEGANSAQHFDDIADAVAYLAASTPAGATVLLKGSRGARLEQLISPLRQAWEGDA